MKRSFSTALVIVALTAIVPHIAAAKDIYIDGDTGSSGNTCTSESSPCSTFDDVESIVLPGDDIFVAGTFTTGFTLSNNFRGTSSDQMIIAAWDGQAQPTITFSDLFGIETIGDYVTIDGFTISTDGNGTPYKTTASNNVLQNSTLSGGLFTVNMSGSSNQVISNVVNAGLIGISVISSDQTVARNLIYCESGNQCNIGISAQGATDSIIKNNILHSFNNSISPGILASAISFTGSSAQDLVVHNTFYDNEVVLAIGDDVSALVVQNNIMHLGSDTEQYVYTYKSTASFPTGYLVDFNDYYSSGSGSIAYIDSGATTYTTLNEWQTATNKDASSFARDPLFVDPTASTPDFTVQSSSTTIDAGQTHPGVVDDFNGNARPVGDEVDLGAYEYGADIDSSEILPPTNIVVNKVKAKKATVNWTAPSLVSSYEITYATNKAFTKNVKIVTAPIGDSYQFTKLKSNQKYHVRIRAMYETDGNTYYSDYTDRITFLTKAVPPKKVLKPVYPTTFERQADGSFLVNLKVKLQGKKKNSRKKLKAVVKLVSNGKKLKFQKFGKTGLKKSQSFKVKGKKNVQTKSFVIPAKYAEKKMTWKVRLQRVKTNKSKFKASKKFVLAQF